jgi:hypothetical protein
MKDRLDGKADETKQQIEEAWRRYLAACHAVQTATAFEIETKGLPAAGASPKHLRVGISTQKVEMGALVGLLIRKGLMTELEWFTSIAAAMEQEKATLESNLPFKLL